VELAPVAEKLLAEAPKDKVLDQAVSVDQVLKVVKHQ
jgi:hypothetical protein